MGSHRRNRKHKPTFHRAYSPRRQRAHMLTKHLPYTKPLKFYYTKSMNPLNYVIGFPGSSVIKNLPANPGDGSSIPGLGRSLEKEMATTPIFLPGKSHRLRWNESKGSQSIRHGLANEQQQYLLKKLGFSVRFPHNLDFIDCIPFI